MNAPRGIRLQRGAVCPPHAFCVPPREDLNQNESTSRSADASFSLGNILRGEARRAEGQRPFSKDNQ